MTARRQLSGSWQFARGNGTDKAPAEGWQQAIVPGTVASSLRALGQWRDDQRVDFDAADWWYRCEFPREGAKYARLGFEGLATLADVWLNGELLVSTDNMFHAHLVDVSEKLKEQNALLVRFRSLKDALKAKRARPRWKTRLVEHANLRWYRTTLLGRMPGWTPPIAAVGPWRPVTLETGAALVDEVSVRTRLDATTGIVQVSARVTTSATGVSATLHVGEGQSALSVSSEGPHAVRLEGALHISDAKAWFPHTHGAQPLYPARIVVEHSSGRVTHALGSLGFRRLEHSREDGDFALSLNGVPIFCRGACWTTLDMAALTSTEGGYRAALEQMKAAGMNMVRVGGTMFYEAEDFYALCDELGILVWQDFMFANMDFPIADPRFRASVDSEVKTLLQRLGHRPSLSMLCGGSEVAQQAAMLGLPETHWSGPLFDEVLPKACAELAPTVPYVPSTPWGGALPFHSNSGVTHYYGVGAYLRPLEDARRAQVRFAAECLALANVPADETIHSFLKDGQRPVHHPAWKERVPRDVGASWDFEDTREHYFKTLFHLDPFEVRAFDPERYLALSRVVPAELMHRTYAEWRRPGSSCRGALVFFLRDLWAGAGWGVIDALGRPKAPYFALKRILQPTAVFFADEGLNGLDIHAVNDLPQDREVELSFSTFREGENRVNLASAKALLKGRGSLRWNAETLLGGFSDTAYAYRFGAPTYDLAIAELRDTRAGTLLSRDVFFTRVLPNTVEPDVGLSVTARRAGAGHVELRIHSKRFAQSVALDVPGHEPDDNFFHVAPGGEVTVNLRGAAGQSVNGTAQALNGRLPAKISLPESGG